MPFDGVFAKLARAREHLDQFRANLAEDIQTNRIGLRIEQDAEYVVYARLPDAILTRYSVIAGDIVHQTRSALEHLAWALVPTPSEYVTGYPVIRIEDDWPTRGHRQISGVSEAIERKIKAMQPFGPDYAKHPLWVLNELWRGEKHRVLNVVAIAALGLTARHLEAGTFTKYTTRQIPADVKDGDVLHREPAPTNAVIHTTFAWTGLTFADGPAAHLDSGGRRIGTAPDELPGEVDRLFGHLHRVVKDHVEDLTTTG